MPLVHRPRIVRVLAYAGTGILILILAVLALGTLWGILWGLVAGPLWLQWAIGAPLALVALTFVGRSFHRKEF